MAQAQTQMPRAKQIIIVEVSARKNCIVLGLRIGHKRPIGASTGKVQQANWTSNQTDIDISWSQVRGRMNVAVELKVVRKISGRAQKQCGAVFMPSVLNVLEDIHRICKTDKLVFGVSGLKFDAATQQFSLDVSSGLRPGQSQS